MFNTKDFADDTPEPVTAMDGPADEASKSDARAQHRQEKRESKAKKMEKKLAEEAQTKEALEDAAGILPTPGADSTMKEKMIAKEARKKKQREKTTVKLPTPAADSTHAIPVKNGRFGPRGPYKKKEKTPDGTPTSAKKRKRDSEVPTPTAIDKDTSILSDGFLEGLKNTMGDLGALFSSQVTANDTPVPPPKKRGRPPGTGKKVVVDSIQPTTQKIADAVANGTPSGESKPKKQKKEKSRESPENDRTFHLIKTPVPVPSIASTLLSRTKTPVPLPQGSASRMAGAMNDHTPKKTKNTHTDSEVLVTETPPSQMSRTPATTHTAPIPFSLPNASTATSTPTGRKKTTKKGPTANVSDVEGGQPPAKAPAKAVTTSHVPLPGSSQSAFTSSNLMNYKEPLNGKPKPRPVGRAASVATSTTSSGSSMSIVEAFARVGKPYTKPGALDDPFTSTSSQKKSHMEKHNEADLATFTTAYRASQKTVNFTDEKEYLDEYLRWSTAALEAGTLPCLNKATGCSPKGEAMLRLSRETDVSNSSLKLLVTTAADAKALEAATLASLEAELFLAHTILARVPMPIGPVEGAWKLFYPRYSATHVDKYGFGQRSLTISSIAGFKPDSSSYTARLSLPPRSMGYTILTFSAPPHASFRTTSLKTTAEGYKAEVIFLGNGYLKLRLDLHLLLMGKPAEGKHGKLGMEFLGVHEKARVWREEGEELRPEEKRFLERFEGVYGR
jgi:hypothetical protein